MDIFLLSSWPAEESTTGKIWNEETNCTDGMFALHGIITSMTGIVPTQNVILLLLMLAIPVVLHSSQFQLMLLAILE